MQTNTNNLSLQEKMQIISKDFLDRDGETFTSARTEGRLDWEKMIGKGGAYSEYILHPKSNEDLISNAYQIATDMVTAMDTPFKVKVNITGSQSCTDSKDLYVATKVFDDKELTVGQKLDTFVGYTVHEGCHLLYTDFKNTSKDKLIHSLENIIEDERIERACGQNKPGLVNFLKSAKYYSFEKYEKEIRAKGGFDKLNRFQKLLNAILAYIRYPKTLDPNDAQEFVDVLLKVKDTLTPYPETSTEVTKAAEEIAKVIKDFLKEDSKNNKSEEDSNNPSNKSDDKESEDKSSDGEEQDTKSESESKSNSEDNAEDMEATGGSGKSDEEIEDEIESSLDGFKEALDQISSEPKKDVTDDEQSDTIKQDGGRVGKVCSGDLERGLEKGSYIQKGTDNKREYDIALSEVKRYIPAVSRALKLQSTEYKVSLKGMRSGVLDTGKLAEAYQGVPTVYMREGEVRTDKVCVCILIDESGSMYGDGETYARQTAILLNEALKKVPSVDLYIYGHTANTKATTDLYVYKERGFNNKYALGSTEARAGNHDSIAIREACARVRKYSKEKCLFFIISDGAPNESPSLVRKAVQDVEKDNFTVVAISIDSYYDPSLMYDRNVTFTDMDRLAIDIGKMVKKAVMGSTKKKINM